MKEEDILKTTFGKANPFRVPEGYFDNLEKRVMSNLPNVEVSKQTVAHKISLWKQLRPYLAAASFLGFMAGGYLVYHNYNSEAPLPVNSVSSITHSEDYNLDSAVDYVMMDNEDFYAYIAGE